MCWSTSTVHGSRFNDVLTGKAGANMIWGGNGNDHWRGEVATMASTVASVSTR